jgi:hypothetical protein
MRKVNDLLLDSLDDPDDSHTVAFFCECADPTCYGPVWLTPSEYERARSARDWTVLADGHAAATLVQA